MITEAPRFEVEPEIITGSRPISLEKLLGLDRIYQLPDGVLRSQNFVDLTRSSLRAFLGYPAPEEVIVRILEGPYGISNEELMVMFPPDESPKNGWSGDGNGGKGSEPKKPITKNSQPPIQPPIPIYQFSDVRRQIR